MNPERWIRWPFFYGWVVVAAAFALNLVGLGVAYSFGAYFEPLSRHFAADRAAVSLVFSLTVLLYCGLGAVTGILADGTERACWRGRRP